QLYVTPDFAYLSEVLEEFANTMALRQGGPDGLKKLINSKNIGTAELSTGLQISGDFKEMIAVKDKVAYLQTTGKTALSYRNKELVGHGTLNHAKGFGTALGKLKGINLAIEDMSPRDLQAYNIYEGKFASLEFEAGIKVEGEIITGTRNLQGKILLISFINCTVSLADRILFKPEWGRYDMAVGKKIISAFAGLADVNSFNLITHSISSIEKKPTIDSAQVELETLYESVRNYREGKNTMYAPEAVFNIIKISHQNDWLLPVEIYEIALQRKKKDFCKEVYEYLKELKVKKRSIAHLIDDGIDLIKEKNLVIT
ncbi:MAG: phenylalanine 4-monooxygenase, partial [Leeuwenhoekiella sp.]